MIDVADLPDPSVLLGYQLWESQYTGILASSTLSVAARLFDPGAIFTKSIRVVHCLRAWYRAGCVSKLPRSNDTNEMTS
jgi:hypothetical protein